MSIAHTLVSPSRTNLAMPLTGMDDTAISRTWASNRAGKCFEPADAHGTSAVTGPPGQSKCGGLQWMNVLYYQMPRWRHVRSRVS